MNRLPVVLLLITAATAVDGAEFGWNDVDLTRYGAWTAAYESRPGPWPCCELFCGPTSSDIQAACFDERSDGSIHLELNGEYRDRDGLKRDTYYFLGYQVVAIGVLYLMPESISSWSDEDKDEYSLSKWWDNVTHPVWDEDDIFLNYVTHPYWGAAYFVRARERSYTNSESFWYSAILSTFYEFGAEALFEPVSIQDVIVTPVFGSFVGAYFMRVRDDIRQRSFARGHRTTKEKWVWALTDPLGTINGQIDRWLGRDVDLQIRPHLQLNRRVRTSTFGPVEWKSDRAVALTFTLRW